MQKPFLSLAVRSTVVVATTFFACAGATGQGVRDPASQYMAVIDDDYDRGLYLKCFDQVWQTVRDVHWDPEKSGEAWDRTRDVYRPIVENAKDEETSRGAIRDMLKSLDQSHFGLISFTAYREIENLSMQGGEGWSGLVIRLVNNVPTIVQVREGSPAEKAGILPGMQVISMRGKTVDSMLDLADDVANTGFFRLETAFGMMADAGSTGGVGKKLDLELSSPDGKRGAFDLTFAEAPGTPSKLGFLPTMQVEYRSKKLTADGGEIGYLAFNAFLDGPRLSKEFSESIEKSRDCKGLIIDLRGNLGGLVGLTMGMCGWMFEEKQSLGEMPAKNGKMVLNLNPRQPAFTLPIAVLVDECSISAAEVMAGGLQDLGRVRVFGRRTAGMVLPSTVTKLPNGDGFQYALSDYYTASGKRLEITGVIPDEAVELDAKKIFNADPRFGRDPDVEAAMAWILKQ